MCVKICEICEKTFEATNSQRYCNDEKCRKILHDRKVYYERYPKEKPIDVTVKVQGEPSWKTISQIAEKVKVGKKERFVSRVAKCKCGESLGRKEDDECANCYSISLRGVVLHPTTKEWLQIESKPYRR